MVPDFSPRDRFSLFVLDIADWWAEGRGREGGEEEESFAQGSRRTLAGQCMGNTRMGDLHEIKATDTTCRSRSDRPPYRAILPTTLPAGHGATGPVQGWQNRRLRGQTAAQWALSLRSIRSCSARAGSRPAGGRTRGRPRGPSRPRRSRRRCGTATCSRRP